VGVGWFAEGGWWMWLVFGADVAVFGFVVLAAVLGVFTFFLGRARVVPRALSAFALLGAALPLLVGVLGWWRNTVAVEAALAVVDPDMRGVIAAQGAYEARIPLWFGVGSALFLAGCALVAVVFAVPRGRVAEEEG
jgi:hypothetical protein